ncbi:MAG: hypothetical protein IJ762_01170 [Bacteroidaceae bacterium]|nr:hypothetical protein [Bacteroidaceae bacterium]
MKYIQRFLVPVLLVVALAVSGWSILKTESEVLYRMQELSLWLPTKLFFKTSTIYPGGVLTWAAAFMTQFFFHPALGIGLMLLAWGIVMWLTCRLFRLHGVWQGLSLLVPLALMACLVQTGYWLYYMKLQGHPWVPTLGVLLSLVLAMPYRRLPNLWSKVGYIAVVGILGYPLMGAWSFLALGLIVMMECGTWSVKRELRTPLSALVLSLFLIGVVPPIMVHQFYGQVQWDTAWLAGMPCFQYGKTDCPEYRWAYYAIVAAFLLCFCQFCRGGIATGAKKDSRPNKSRAKSGYDKELVWGSILVVALLSLGAWGVSKRWERDTNFHKEVAMTNAIHRLDWEGVLHVMLSQDMGPLMPPTRVMVMMKNLALFRLGRAGDEMFRYPEGAEQQHAPWQVRMTQVGGKLLYYHYGKEGFCYRWCMEDGVEFGWSVDVLKYMTKCSLITHDWDVAQKYINLLKKTRYHRQWAEQYETYIRHPELMKEDEEMKPIIPMAEFGDRLDGDNTLVELYLMKTFSSGFGADPGYQEMTLLSALIMKDIDLFWPRFRQYLNMHQREEGFRVPRYYQEAAYLYSMLEPQRPSELWPGDTNAQAMQRLPFDESVKSSYQRFMDFNTQCGSMNEEQKKRAFQPMFGDTFYYFYFLVRNQKTN